MSDTTGRFRVLTGQQWEPVESLLTSSDGRRGRPFRNSRVVVEGISYRYRTGIPWRDLPREIHAGVDGHGRPLSVVVTGGQRNDGAMIQAVRD